MLKFKGPADLNQKHDAVYQSVTQRWVENISKLCTINQDTFNAKVQV